MMSRILVEIPVRFLDRLTTGGDVEEFPFWWIGYYENGGVCECEYHWVRFTCIYK
ncbi:hypothetical protein HanRHA438_Chr15g0702731 [Helianthus annuus]|nr:hypothetical protein HanRHA438_Chr15g0702731 [Helianthus annuus]